MEDYEKKYKDALLIVRKLQENWRSTNNRAASEIEEAFPELKESEDERIREWLIGYFNQYIADGMGNFAGGFKVDDILAWLEKQHEQKVIIPKFRVGDTIRLTDSSAEYTITDISDGYYHGKGWRLDIVSADQSGHYELVGQKIDEWSDIVVSKPPQVWLRG